MHEAFYRWNYEFTPWYLIFKCTVEGTAPKELRVGLPRIQLYVVLHKTTMYLTWMVFADDGSSLSLKEVDTVTDPSGRVAVPSNVVSCPSCTLEMLRLAIVAVMSSGRSPLGVPFTRSESENPR
ncbi:hypothetical protein A2U01_0005661, partial [Trifolium medium]|nr:hypothetical protein [Trifolium medium]